MFGVRCSGFAEGSKSGAAESGVETPNSELKNSETLNRRSAVDNRQFPTPQRQRGHALDLSGYLAELDRCSAAVERLKIHPEEAAALRNSLPESWRVTAESQDFEVPTGWLRQRLDGFPSEPAQAADRSRQILARLRGMRSSAGALFQSGSQGGIADGNSGRRRLDVILQRREFRESVARSQVQTWWDRAQRWVRDLLARLFGQVGYYGPGSTVFWVLAVGLGMALLGWLAYSMMGLARAPARSRPPRAVEIAGWREWAAKAVDCARRNEFREAIHMAYRAAVYRLEDAGVWQVDDTRTPREYLRLITADDRHYQALRAITFRFERSWYGFQPASADDFESAVAELKDLGCLLDWNPVTATS